MTPCAQEALQSLLKLGESAALRGDTRLVGIKFDGARFQAYKQISSWDEKQQVHGELKAAEAEGAITIKWSRLGGDDRPIERIALSDLGALSKLLGVQLYASKVEEAEQRLASWLGKSPRTAEILEQWKAGRSVRGLGPEAAGDILDGLAAVSYQIQQPEDTILRRVSALLFNDSKRLERLTPILDALTAQALSDRARPAREVWAALGLKKIPSPALFGGAAEILLVDGRKSPRIDPYLGLPPPAVAGVASSIEYLLTVENLTPFHELVHLAPQRGLVLYSDGMPSPAWRTMYRRLLASLGAVTQVYHWGDLDEGGFRIAGVLAAEARAEERDLKPWRMAPADVPSDIVARQASGSKATRMAASAEAAGWQQVAEQIRQSRMMLEQERLPVVSADTIGLSSG